jgi:hypothetical protein
VSTSPYPADNSVFLIISGTQNLSAYYRVGSYQVCNYYPYGYPCAPYRYAIPITVTAAQAQALDEQLFAKNVGSVKINPVYGSSASSALSEDVNSGLRQVVPFQVGHKIVINGKSIRLIPELSTIEVVFADGSKVKLVYKNMFSTIAWEIVSRTDSNGNEITVNNGTGGSGGSASPPPPYTYAPPPFNYCPVQVISHVCIEEVGSNGACPQGDSGEVTIFLRPCG